MRVRMLQSRICVSPGLPPSPPPLPSLMPKEEIVLVKFGGRVVPVPRRSLAGTGRIWGAQREMAPPRQAGGHRHGSGGSTDEGEVPPQAGRLTAILASRSHGCLPLSGIQAIFGVFHAKIHSKEMRLHLSGTAGSPWAARTPHCPKQPPDPVPPHAAGPPAAPDQPLPQPLRPSTGSA